MSGSTIILRPTEIGRTLIVGATAIVPKAYIKTYEIAIEVFLAPSEREGDHRLSINTKYHPYYYIQSENMGMWRSW